LAETARSGCAGAKGKAAKQGRPPQRERPRTLTFKEIKEIECLPALIESLEAERAGLYESLADPNFYRKDSGSLPAAKAKIEELEKKIASSYERWELLDSIPKGPVSEPRLTVVPTSSL